MYNMYIVTLYSVLFSSSFSDCIATNTNCVSIAMPYSTTSTPGDTATLSSISSSLTNLFMYLQNVF